MRFTLLMDLGVGFVVWIFLGWVFLVGVCIVWAWVLIDCLICWFGLLALLGLNFEFCAHFIAGHLLCVLCCIVFFGPVIWVLFGFWIGCFGLLGWWYCYCVSLRSYWYECGGCFVCECFAGCLFCFE